MLRSAAYRLVLPLLAVAVALPACHGRETPDDLVLGSLTDIGRVSQGERWDRDRVIEVATAGPIVVEVRSFGGAVSVRANPRLAETRVWVERRAAHGFGRYAEAAAAMAAIDYTVSLERGESGEEILLVRSECDSPETLLVDATISIETPDLDRVFIRTARGDVTVLGNRGPVDIVTSHGDVRVATPWPMREPIRIMNTDGGVEYRIRAESTGRFDLATIGGEIRQRCERGTWVKVDPENRHDRMVASFNGGDNPVLIRTSEGDIAIAVVSDPIGVGEFLSGR